MDEGKGQAGQAQKPGETAMGWDRVGMLAGIDNGRNSNNNNNKRPLTPKSMPGRNSNAVIIPG